MTLEIDPNTPKGQVQIEAIQWAQDQINEILKQYFADKYRIQKGLFINFRLKMDNMMNQKIRVDISSLEPETEKRFAEAVAQAQSQIQFKPEEPEIKEGEVISPPQKGGKVRGIDEG